ncbi:MAG: GTPase Era [Bacteroidetes bacterium]|jgi:GTPase|nr:GTPase Era [Bacteroidota bacterium]MBT3749603.1 GTPase Era [Bacteroidota bacterium]MBT4401699.1 GTPase Era [Bacteroidota bacterium]MBT4411441.1 GTPase Era [Bacteroidota bacterium]MBT5427157.1 GTPase Era [Bacteroidota bacterium]
MTVIHKSGFVNIVGNPNVGKSTLMNALVGERISIITSKSQTTRHRILGIVNGDDFQIIYSDTPGVIKPNYKLQESMLKYSRSALQDADIILYMTDIKEKADKNEEFLDAVSKASVPVLLIINKIDLSKQQDIEEMVLEWQKRLPNAEIYPSSALHRFNLDNLLNRIKELLPENPPFFDKDALTDKPERFFVTEIIRGQILENYRQEVPYAVEPEVESFKEEENIIRIMVKIHVERDSQKGILIGQKGLALKKIGVESRKELEAFFDKRVHLELFVTVSKDWRNKLPKLKSFGYDQ